jgi:hypothetical protein
MMSTPSDVALADRYMRRIERLARRFLTLRFSGAQGMWQFERRLLATQQDIQGAIAHAKRAPRRTRDTQTVE